MTKFTSYLLITLLALFYFIFQLSVIDKFGQTADSSLVLKRGAYYFYDYSTLGYQGIYEKIPNAKLRSYGPLYSTMVVASKHYLHDVYSVFTDPVHAYHFPNILTASLALFFLGIFLYWVWGFPTAIMAMLVLILAPKFFGHTQSNYKDISTLAFFMVALVCLYYATIKERLTLWIIAGFFVGLCYCVRAHALMLLPIISLWYFLIQLLPLLIQYIKTKDNNYFKQFFSAGIIFSAKAFVCLVVASLTVMLFWPYYRVEPLTKFLETFSVMSGYEWAFYERYLGTLYKANEMPWHYPIVYLAITLPTFYLITFIAGVILTVKKFIDKSVDAPLLVLLLIAVIIPPAIHIALGTPKYGGMRHYLLIYPYLAVIIAYTLSQLVKYSQNSKNKLAKVLIIIPVFILLNQVYQNYKLYPLTYLYFNSIVGGEAGANKLFSLDIRKQSRQHVNRWIKTQNVNNKYTVYYAKDLARLDPKEAEEIRRRPAVFKYKVNETPIAYVFLED